MTQDKADPSPRDGKTTRHSDVDKEVRSILQQVDAINRRSSRIWITMVVLMMVGMVIAVLLALLLMRLIGL